MTNIATVNVNAKLSGMYKFSIERPDGSVKESGWIENLILNSGLDQLGDSENYNSLLDTLQVGTGTIPTDPTQTSLQSPIANVVRANYSNIGKGAPLYQGETTQEYRFVQGAVVGNITEVGVGVNASLGLFSRSLITDEKGVPTALTVVALDKLTVYYRLQIFPTLTDSSGSFIINNVTYNYVSRICNISNISRDRLLAYYFSKLQRVQSFDETCTGLSNITIQPNGYSSTTYSCVNEVYSPGTFTTKASASFSPDQGAVPIKAVVCSFAADTQLVFSPSIPKSNTNQLVLRFSFSWGRG